MRCKVKNSKGFLDCHLKVFLLHRLEKNWKDPVGFKTHMIVCPSVDANAAIHCQIDDDYLALKNTDGNLKVWSKKSYK